MKNYQFVFAIMLVAFAFPTSVMSQVPGVHRTNLQQHNLSIPGREYVQAKIAIDPGVIAPRHSHPGEEIIYVLEGALEYQLDGEEPKIYKPGEVLFIPAGKIHSARNVGKSTAAELATYIVEIGKPLLVIAK